MLIIVVYDVKTEDVAGKSRLRKVAKECMKYGHRVQNSVFECFIDSMQKRIFQERLFNLIDRKNDKLIFYNLGNNYENRIDRYGKDDSVNLEKDTLII